MQSTSVYTQSRCTLTYSHRALSYSSFLHGSRMGEAQCRDICNVKISNVYHRRMQTCVVIVILCSPQIPVDCLPQTLSLNSKSTRDLRMLDACVVDLTDVERRLMIYYHAARSSLWSNHHLGAPSSTAGPRHGWGLQPNTILSRLFKSSTL